MRRMLISQCLAAMLFVHLPSIGALCQEIEEDNTAYVLMTNIEFVFNGQRWDRLMLRSQIIIK